MSIHAGSRAPGTLLAETFVRLKRQRRTALMPFFTAGYPAPEVYRALLHTAGPAGADVLEIGIPFSDPLADGPAIQHSSQVALRHGTTLAGALEELRIEQQRARRSGPAAPQSAAHPSSGLPPVVVMTYVNPVLGLGWDVFADAAADAGVSGVIVPDLPLEEGKELEEKLARRKIDLVYLAAPTTGTSRLRELGRRSRGFLYLVSVTGVTGERAALPADVAEFVKRARAASELPLCLGFGIASAEQAAKAARHVDGVIVGSAIVNRIREWEDGGAGCDTDAVVGAVTGFLRELRSGLDAEAGGGGTS